jgi:hypothetical protein
MDAAAERRSEQLVPRLYSMSKSLSFMMQMPSCFMIPMTSSFMMWVTSSSGSLLANGVR